MKKTKIICTIGPASQEQATLEKLIKAGMNCARLNFSHGTEKNFQLIINNLKKAKQKCQAKIATIQDLQGPKIRVNELKESIKVKKNQKIILSTGKSSHSEFITIPIQYKDLPKDVDKNDTILIDDGLIECKVLSSNKKDQITCLVLNKGEIKSHKGINVPHKKIALNSITKKDIKDLIFGLKYDFDYIALSFVSCAKDIKNLRNLLKKHKSKSKIIAKIEQSEAIKNIDEIIQESDAIMVARGDLALEIDAEKVPIIQKEIVRKCNLKGKPCIIATQMLQSMVENPRASRAEISDTATAIFDHADAVMLSNETATGKYPIKAVQTLSKVAISVEKDLQKKQHLLPNRIKNADLPIFKATCLNVCELANDIQAKAIIILSDSGNTAQMIARHRPYIPIYTFTNKEKTINFLSLVWGINKTFKSEKKLHNEKTQEIIKYIKSFIPIKKGDEIVIANLESNKNTIISTKI